MISGCSAECLEWKIRYKIALGVADGLKYLHHDCHRRIIHRDIKASNILLADDFDAQVSSFSQPPIPYFLSLIFFLNVHT